jgi:cytochrome c553
MASGRLSASIAAAAIGVLGALALGRAAPPPSAPSDARGDTLRLHMHGNFDLLRAIERLLIRGRLEDAARLATAIAEVPDAPAHGSYAAHAVRVRDRAAAVARATALDQACALDAQLAAACGDCHVESGAAPMFRQFPPLPADLPTVAGRMARHRWAADRLWEAMIGGADEPWKAGLDVLAAAPLEFADRPDRAPLARALHQLAVTARKRLDVRDRRATAYGELLAACAACHTAPPPRR